MALNVSDKGGQRPLTPAGTHIARCYQLIDLGTQRDTFQGKPKVQAKIMLKWELPNETATFDDTKGEQPFTVTKEYTASLGEKANLRHDLEGWRGRAFTDEELKGFDLKNIVGKTCMITVVHYKKQNGSMGDKVTSVAAIPKDPKTKKPMEVPAQVNASVVYDIEDGQNDVFVLLPDWIKKKILQSDEFNGGGASQSQGGQDDSGEPEGSDIPF